MLSIDFDVRGSHDCKLDGGVPMADHLKLPPALSEEPTAPKPTGPSDQKIIENLKRWANSRGLQPPTLPNHKAN